MDMSELPKVKYSTPSVLQQVMDLLMSQSAPHEFRIVQRTQQRGDVQYLTFVGVEVPAPEEK